MNVILVANFSSFLSLWISSPTVCYLTQAGQQACSALTVDLLAIDAPCVIETNSSGIIETVSPYFSLGWLPLTFRIVGACTADQRGIGKILSYKTEAVLLD